MDDEPLPFVISGGNSRLTGKCLIKIGIGRKAALFINGSRRETGFQIILCKVNPFHQDVLVNGGLRIFLELVQEVIFGHVKVSGQLVKRRCP